MWSAKIGLTSGSTAGVSATARIEGSWKTNTAKRRRGRRDVFMGRTDGELVWRRAERMTNVETDEFEGEAFNGLMLDSTAF
jgi:hypothetical protein